MTFQNLWSPFYLNTWRVSPWCCWSLHSALKCGATSAWLFKSALYSNHARTRWSGACMFSLCKFSSDCPFGAAHSFLAPARQCLRPICHSKPALCAASAEMMAMRCSDPGSTQGRGQVFHTHTPQRDERASACWSPSPRERNRRTGFAELLRGTGRRAQPLECVRQDITRAEWNAGPAAIWGLSLKMLTGIWMH